LQFTEGLRIVICVSATRRVGRAAGELLPAKAPA
jgi:hypothetical protein